MHGRLSLPLSFSLGFERDASFLINTDCEDAFRLDWVLAPSPGTPGSAGTDIFPDGRRDDQQCSAPVFLNAQGN
jgi:hypothetical protein